MTTVDPPPETALEKHLRLQQEREEKNQLYRLYTRTSIGALEVGLSVIVGALMGSYVDDHWWTHKPYGLYIGFVAGCAAAVRQLYRLVKTEQARQEREEAKEALQQKQQTTETPSSFSQIQDPPL